jgi:D-beta-D-heptose 7-phosphate kinase/D-beta-D-heptose 1-phosphate adenosyltransferase
MAFMYSQYDALVISDYDKGFLTEQSLRTICTYFKGPIFIDTKKTRLFQQSNVFFKINKKEYDLLDRKFMPHDTNLIVTLGSNGCKWSGIHFQPRKVNVFDVCGAGDTFLSALVFEFIRTKNMQKSIDFANRAASISVENPGTHKLTKDDIVRIYNESI